MANEEDPAGSPGQGGEFNGVTDAFTDVMYFQAGGAVIYDEFRATAEANGVQAVPDLGDRAFTYSGGNGPGAVVARGGKLFTIEFHGIGDGAFERARCSSSPNKPWVASTDRGQFGQTSSGTLSSGPTRW